MIIYVCTNKIDNFKYIGCTIRKLNDRKCSHYDAAYNCKKKNHFYRALRKYGWDNFEWQIIDTALTHEELLLKEKYYIQLFETFRKAGYNETVGGRGCVGWKHTEETKKKIGKSSKERAVGRKLKESTKLKISKFFKGKSHVELYGEQKASELSKI